MCDIGLMQYQKPPLVSSTSILPPQGTAILSWDREVGALGIRPPHVDGWMSLGEILQTYTLPYERK